MSISVALYLELREIALKYEHGLFNMPMHKQYALHEIYRFRMSISSTSKQYVHATTTVSSVPMRNLGYLFPSDGISFLRAPVRGLF